LVYNLDKVYNSKDDIKELFRIYGMA